MHGVSLDRLSLDRLGLGHGRLGLGHGLCVTDPRVDDAVAVVVDGVNLAISCCVIADSCEKGEGG